MIRIATIKNRFLFRCFLSLPDSFQHLNFYQSRKNLSAPRLLQQACNHRRLQSTAYRRKCDYWLTRASRSVFQTVMSCFYADIILHLLMLNSSFCWRYLQRDIYAYLIFRWPVHFLVGYLFELSARSFSR